MTAEIKTEGPSPYLTALKGRGRRRIVFTQRSKSRTSATMGALARRNQECLRYAELHPKVFRVRIRRNGIPLRHPLTNGLPVLLNKISLILESFFIYAPASFSYVSDVNWLVRWSVPATLCLAGEKPPTEQRLQVSGTNLRNDDRPCRNPPYAQLDRACMRLFKHPLSGPAAEEIR